MSPKRPSSDVYQSFLLRCWQEGNEDEPRQTWRFALTQVGNDDERLGFTTLWDVFAYLEKHLCPSLTPTTEFARPEHSRTQHAAAYFLDQG